MFAHGVRTTEKRTKILRSGDDSMFDAMLTDAIMCDFLRFHTVKLFVFVFMRGNRSGVLGIICLIHDNHVCLPTGDTCQRLRYRSCVTLLSATLGELQGLSWQALETTETYKGGRKKKAAKLICWQTYAVQRRGRRRDKRRERPSRTKCGLMYLGTRIPWKSCSSESASGDLSPSQPFFPISEYGNLPCFRSSP
ncbi:unnamed protein product [Caenorhabditis auriculariae]|uniref:Uncharacterized protein n=1 Tax=Caenorhabditis auriculariae TaxID=2777116 RepID=A0A8S1GMI7_9PELO|nr:unnamed protein product [Caenorhabditis auriculariae]